VTPQRPDSHALGDIAVNAFERVVLGAGWVWNPTRSGSDYGIDGFVSLRDQSKTVLPIDIPVQVKGVRALKRSADYGVANTVTRDAVDLLRAHVLGGYFIVYDRATGDLFFVHSDAIATETDRSSGRTQRLRVPLANRIEASSLEALRGDAERRHKMLRRLLAVDENMRNVRELYMRLTVIQQVLLEFVATLAMVSPDHVAHVSATFASAAGADIDSVALETASAVLCEYEVQPPVAYLSPLIGTSTMLTTIRWAYESVDDLSSCLRTEERSTLLAALGLDGLRGSLRSSMRRAFGVDPLKPLEPGVHALHVNAVHFVVGTVMVSLIVNQLVHELRNEVFTDFAHSLSSSPMSSLLSVAPERWVRHRGDGADGHKTGAQKDSS